MTALDTAAEALGIRIGMPAAKAQALAPSLVLRKADPWADAEALDRLALRALLRISPMVAADPPDGLVIETSGADHLHGGEARMLDRLARSLTRAGIEARAAVAGSWGAAHAAARFLARRTTVVPPGRDEALLRRLPVAALRLDSETARSLRTLGFDLVGDLLDRPRAPLALRFGPRLVGRLDQALGLAAEPIEPVREARIVEIRRVFAEPIGAPETIARYVDKIVGALCAELEARGLGARRLDLLFHRIDGTRQAIRAGTARPARQAGHLTRLFREKIGAVEPGFGIEAMALAAVLAEPLGARQAVSPLAEEPEADLSDLIDILASRVGEHRLCRFAPVESDVPERSVARISPLAPETGAGWESRWPRPPRLLPRPEPVETMALLPDHPPVWFTWRGLRRRVRRADGPERIRGEWWKRDAEMAAVRDYFRVEDEAGERYWLFRSGDGERPESGSRRWFLHGIFG